MVRMESICMLWLCSIIITRSVCHAHALTNPQNSNHDGAIYSFHKPITNRNWSNASDFYYEISSRKPTIYHIFRFIFFVCLWRTMDNTTTFAESMAKRNHKIQYFQRLIFVRAFSAIIHQCVFVTTSTIISFESKMTHLRPRTMHVVSERIRTKSRKMFIIFCSIECRLSNPLPRMGSYSRRNYYWKADISNP